MYLLDEGLTVLMKDIAERKKLERKVVRGFLQLMQKKIGDEDIILEPAEIPDLCLNDK